MRIMSYTNFSNRLTKSTKLTIEHHSVKVEVELPWDANIDEMKDAFKTLLYGVKFDAECIEELFAEEK